MKTLRNIIIPITILLYIAVFCYCEYMERPIVIPEPEDIAETLLPKKVVSKPEPVELVRTIYVFEKVDILNRKATTYSKYDGRVEAKGKYANNKYSKRLHYRERNIQTEHYTVALNYQDRRYHNIIIQVNGQWTHKYRLHVPGYNKSTIGHYTDFLNLSYDPFFSVPRDRMTHKKNCKYCAEKRIDILHTGYEGAVKRKQRKWCRDNRAYINIPVYEMKQYNIYSNGSRIHVPFKEYRK